MKYTQTKDVNGRTLYWKVVNGKKIRIPKNSVTISECAPRQAPYLKDLRIEARKAGIANWYNLRKEELCYKLGYIKKKPTIKKRSIRKKTVVKNVDPFGIKSFISKNNLIPLPVKDVDNRHPIPRGFTTEYYVWDDKTLRGRPGRSIRRWILPYNKKLRWKYDGEEREDSLKDIARIGGLEAKILTGRSIDDFTWALSSAIGNFNWKTHGFAYKNKNKKGNDYMKGYKAFIVPKPQRLYSLRKNKQQYEKNL